jgi:hypothetical protein
MLENQEKKRPHLAVGKAAVGESSHSRYIRGETIAVRTHQQHAQQQHLLETNRTAGDANSSRDVKAGGHTSRRWYVNNSWDPRTGTPGRLTAEELHLQ